MSEITVTAAQIDALADKLAMMPLDETEMTLLIALLAAGVEAISPADVEGFMIAPGYEPESGVPEKVKVKVMGDGSVRPGSFVGTSGKAPFGFVLGGLFAAI